MSQQRESDSTPGRPSKVVTLIDRYDLGDIGATLETEWTRDGSERLSLRELAAYFNRELLRRSLLDADVQPLSGEVENFHRLLTADSTSTADRTRARRRLEREGIDVDRLLTDFVSYQAIRTYLQNHRGASYEADDGQSVEQLRDVVKRLQNKLVTVTENRLERATSGDDIDIENPNVIADVQIVCMDCGRRLTVDELSHETDCDCS